MRSTLFSTTTLDNLLQREIDLTTALLELLGRESAALAGNETLDPNGQQEKLTLVTTLQQATRTRIEYANAHNLPLAKTGATAPAATESSSARLYTQLMLLAGECREQNLQIGRHLNRRARFVNGMLDSLTPAGASTRAEIYGEDGRTRPDRRGDLLNLAGT